MFHQVRHSPYQNFATNVAGHLTIDRIATPLGGGGS